jgi:hypothetical protein
VLRCQTGLLQQECSGIAEAVLAAATPLIEAAALERAAKVAESYGNEYDYDGLIAAAIRALKEQT